MKVTLRDIASAMNISVSTVSRALNNHPNVDVDTRENVQATAKKMGYALNNLRVHKQAYRVLLLRHSSISSDVPNRDDSLTLGAQRFLDTKGVHSQAQRLSAELEDTLPSTDVSNGKVDGVVLIGGMKHVKLIKRLQHLKLPFVVAGAGVTLANVNYVSADYLSGTENAVAYLVSKQRSRIGFVNGTKSTLSSEEKLKGYRLGLLAHKLPYNPQYVIESKFNAEDGYTQTRKLFKQAPELDAVLFAGDDIAMGGIHALKELGKRIPGDISVMGYYDHGIAKFIDPPLSSVAVDLQKIGAIAAERLLMLLDAPQDAWRIVLPTSLVLRDSA